MIETTLFQQARLDDIKHALSIYSQRHSVVTENISHVATEGYRCQELGFEEYLDTAQRSLRGIRTHTNHLPIGRHQIDETPGSVEITDTAFDNGINNVNIDEQMSNLVTNDLVYRLATRLLSMKYRMLRGAINGHIR